MHSLIRILVCLILVSCSNNWLKSNIAYDVPTQQIDIVIENNVVDNNIANNKDQAEHNYNAHYVMDFETLLNIQKEALIFDINNYDDLIYLQKWLVSREDLPVSAQFVNCIAKNST